jgi:hypothetical protein
VLEGLSRPLPKRADGGELHPQARRWYELWADSGAPEAWSEWHWWQLETTALLVDAYFEKPSASALAQIRATERILEEA